MFRKLRCSHLIVCFICLLLVVGSGRAQETAVSPLPAVTAAATAERVRFTAPSTVQQIRLEVYDAVGAKRFDNEVRGGNVLDWRLQDGQAEPLADGAYLCLVTVKYVSGRLSQKLGTVTIEQRQSTVQPAEASQINAQQAQAIGPVEAQAGLIVPGGAEPPTATVIAHTGSEGQLIRGSGALSFRLGDFYRGQDQEQMRLTAEGKLGLGVTDPQAKLDVAGLIRTSEGIVFPDGTVQTTAYIASGRSLSERVGLQRDAQGRSVIEQDKPGSVQQMLRLAPAATPGRLAKFAADGVTPVDTQVSESNGALVVGNADATGNIQIFGQAGQDVFAGMGPDVNVGPAFNYGYAGSSFGRSAGFFNVRPDASAVAPNPSLRFLTANQQRMIITNTGNVGIGTTAPNTLLEVNGVLRSTRNGQPGQYLQLAGGDAFSIRLTAQSIVSAEKPLLIQNLSGEAAPGANNNIQFQVGTTAAPSTKMMIDKDGDVGIGTTASTEYKLQVVSEFSAIKGKSSQLVGVTGESNSGPGVYGSSKTHNGVAGFSEFGIGVYGISTNNYGLKGYSGNGIGVYGLSDNSTGVYGSGGNGLAGYFAGDVFVAGTISNAVVSFKIDHPLDPANKYLYHTGIESPDMKNLYDGNVTTDEHGEATVTLPEWFETLNRDFRYQLTVISEFAQAIVASKIKHNRFTIKTDKPRVEVSWQVTGIRQDAYANAYRMPIEEEKSAKERGYYIHPTLFEQSEEQGIEWARHPEQMRQMKEQREKAQKEKLQKEQP